MTSIGSYTKQIPLNNGYFRCVQALSGTNVSSLVYLALGTTAGGTISTMSTNTAVGEYFSTNALSLSSALFKDMGAQAVVNGSTFRRLQPVLAIPTTGGVAGPNAGVDSDYLSFWILTGFNGAGAAGPFIRTG